MILKITYQNLLILFKEKFILNFNWIDFVQSEDVPHVKIKYENMLENPLMK